MRTPRINGIRAPGPAQAVLDFEAWPSVDYIVEYRDRLGGGAGSWWQDFLRAPTYRIVRWTNAGPGASRFCRLQARP